MSSVSKPAFPALGDLIEQHGGYPQITAEAWEHYDREVKRWLARQQSGLPYQEAHERAMIDRMALGRPETGQGSDKTQGRYPTSTIEAGVHLVAWGGDPKYFYRWLARHAPERARALELAREIWRALDKSENRMRLELWIRLYQREHPER